MLVKRVVTYNNGFFPFEELEACCVRVEYQVKAFLSFYLICLFYQILHYATSHIKTFISVTNLFPEHLLLHHQDINT